MTFWLIWETTPFRRLSFGPMSCLNRYMAVSAIERW